MLIAARIEGRKIAADQPAQTDLGGEILKIVRRESQAYNKLLIRRSVSES